MEFVFSTFLTLSDSPVNADCPTYKLFVSIILKSAGMMLPADNNTISPIVILFTGTWISSLLLKIDTVVATSAFNFSAALFDLNSSKNSRSVLTATKTNITRIFA